MYGFCWLSLIAMLLLSEATDAAQKAPFSEAIRFHSDNTFLTSRVNQPPHQPYSTAVDTAQMLMDAISYNAQILNVPLARSFMQIDAGDPICVVNKIKSPQRSQKYVFSKPLNFFQTQRLYQLSSLKPISEHLLDDQGQVISVSDVLEEYESSAIILPENYSFGAFLDSDLGKIDATQVITMSNNAFYHQFMRIFAKQRVDFALAFPASMYINFGDTQPAKTRSYSIANNPKFVTGHIICSDSDIGHAMVQSVNDAIELLYQDPAFIHAHTAYLPVAAQAEIREIIRSAVPREITIIGGA